jgi:hypothetical protein
MSVTINGTSGITYPDVSTQNTSPKTGFVNRIINGAMTIDQRNAGAAVTANGTYPVDRFLIGNGTDGAFSAQRDTVAPSGFINSLKVTTTTADATLTTTQGLLAAHYIEGLNVADLAWGTASAQPVTLSFWVRSSLTGTFGGSLQNSALDRSYPFTYTISSANTYEYKTITVPGDTSGTWLTTNGIGLRLWFGLGVGPDRSGTAGAWSGSDLRSVTGAVSVIGTLSATWFITGVQLEKGSVVTPFEFRSIGTELALCQRYAQPIGQGSSGSISSATLAEMACMFRTQMRANPTITFGGFSGASTQVLQWTIGGVTATAVAGPGPYISPSGVYLALTISGATAGKIAGIITGDVCFASAEL